MKKKLLLVLLIGLLVRLLFFYFSPMPIDGTKLLTYLPDENVYYTIAEKIGKEGFLNAFFDESSIWVAPFNPIYLYILSGITSSPILFIRMFNILISVFTAYVLYRIGVIQFNKKTGILSALVFCIYFPLIELSPTMLTEPIYILLFLSSIYFMIKGYKENKLKHYIISSLLIGAATLTRSILLLLPFIISFYYIFVNFKEKQIVKNYLIYLGIFILLISPVFIKNYLIFNKATISNGSGAALYLGSRPDTEGDEPPYRGKSYNTMEITTPFTHLQSEGDTRLQKVAISNIKNNFREYLYWDFKKIGRLLVGNKFSWFFPYDNVYSYYINNGFIKTGIKLFNMLIALSVCIIGGANLLKHLFVNRRINKIPIFAFYHIVLSLPFLVIPRYGLPVFCLLIIYFSAALTLKNPKNDKEVSGL